MPTVRARKSLQSLFVEAVLLISLFTLVGHLSVNFWERYVVQNELSQMKTSLHSLKNTIDNISTAYQQLHKELYTLANEAVKTNYVEEILPNKHDHIKRYPIALTDDLIEEIQIRSLMDSGKGPKKIQAEKTQTTANNDTQTNVNETTSFNPPPVLKPQCKDENVGDRGFHHKKIQFTRKFMDNLESKRDKEKEQCDATGISPISPLKSIAAKTQLNAFQGSNSLLSDFNNYYVTENDKYKNTTCCSGPNNNCDSYFIF